MADDDYCYLTTTGRRSGQPHRIEIWYASDGNTLYLLSGGGRSSDWVQNLEANPNVVIEVDRDVRGGRARILDEGDEEKRARSLVFDKYSARTADNLVSWRASALPVAVELHEDALPE